MKYKIDLRLLFFILALHGLGDFFLQSTWMATNKSHNNKALLAHGVVYSAVLSVANPVWGISNGLAHISVDYISSKLVADNYKNNPKKFIRIIFFDQIIHVLCLILSWQLFGFKFWWLNFKPKIRSKS